MKKLPKHSPGIQNSRSFSAGFQHSPNDSLSDSPTPSLSPGPNTPCRSPAPDLSCGMTPTLSHCQIQSYLLRFVIRYASINNPSFKESNSWIKNNNYWKVILFLNKIVPWLIGTISHGTISHGTYWKIFEKLFSLSDIVWGSLQTLMIVCQHQ